jgi:hypothetical protein
MDKNQAVIFATYIGSKLQDEFLKLFSGGIEESELVTNKLLKHSDLADEKNDIAH